MKCVFKIRLIFKLLANVIRFWWSRLADNWSVHADELMEPKQTYPLGIIWCCKRKDYGGCLQGEKYGDTREFDAITEGIVTDEDVWNRSQNFTRFSYPASENLSSTMAPSARGGLGRLARSQGHDSACSILFQLTKWTSCHRWWSSGHSDPSLYLLQQCIFCCVTTWAWYM